MTEKLKILRADRELRCDAVDAHLLDRDADMVLTPSGMEDLDFLRQASDADLILTCYQPITATLINKATRLKGIIKYGVGIDAIDVDAANRCGIPVVNVPDYAEETVAECAFTLLLWLAKKVGPIQQQMNRHGWVWPVPPWAGSDVAGKTIGIVGFGRIGQKMARMAGAGFRARVLVYDPAVSAAQAKAADVELFSDLRTMLADCDFVSLHATLSPGSRHLISAPELACMKQSAYLVNVSRGELVDERALVQALRENQISGAGLDTYGQEPLAHTGHPMSALMSMDNVIMFPHLAFYTEGAMQRLEAETIARCDEILAGEPVLIKSTDPRLTAQPHGVTFNE